LRIAIFQPDIPQNTGALLRLAACLSLSVDIIEPLGFIWDDKRLRRAGMDYTALARVTRHASWSAFRAARAAAEGGRLVLLTTRAETTHLEFAFRPDDVLLLGQESAGVPENVQKEVDARVRIPIAADARSLNVVTAAALVTGEALRQTGGWPGS